MSIYSILMYEVRVEGVFYGFIMLKCFLPASEHQQFSLAPSCMNRYKGRTLKVNSHIGQHLYLESVRFQHHHLVASS